MHSAASARLPDAQEGPDVPDCGLRERKKRQTRRDLHRTALELVSAEGLEAVTIERITEAVGVSRRTFFNYFPTKEMAVLGLDTEPEVELERFVDARPLSEHAWVSLVHVVRSILACRMADREAVRTVAHRYPELLKGTAPAADEVRESGRRVVARRLEKQGFDAAEARRRAVTYVDLAWMVLGTSSALAAEQHLEFDEALANVTRVLGALPDPFAG